MVEALSDAFFVSKIYKIGFYGADWLISTYNDFFYTLILNL